MKRYQVLYQGRLAVSCITKAGAQAKAFQMAKEKGWNVAQIEVKELIYKENN